MTSKIVAVTGASGFIATEIIAQLIEKGYNVRGSVRDLNNPDKVSHLKELFPSIQLFEADLIKPGSFDTMIAGADFVLHTASPFFITPKEDAQKELVDPALEGTKNVLNSVVKAGTVKVVVVTSSVAAIVQEVHEGDPNKVWTEEDWNTTSTLTKGPYRLSKSLAERAAWEWAKEHPTIKLVTVNPTLVLGPPRSKRVDATSIINIKALVDGSMKEVPATALGCVDVRDVARTHIALIETPNVNGRYMVTSERVYSRLELANFVKAKFPQYPVPEKQNGDVSKHLLLKFSTKKVQTELGITLNPIEKAVTDMVQAFIDLGIVEKRQ